jgi:hypothetical protein
MFNFSVFNCHLACHYFKLIFNAMGGFVGGVMSSFFHGESLKISHLTE